MNIIPISKNIYILKCKYLKSLIIDTKMNITSKLGVEPKKELPQLIKQSATYKLIVPRKVEEKIRYLIR